MRKKARALAFSLIAILTAMGVLVGATLTAVVALAAVPVTALVVPGTSTSNPDNVAMFEQNARNYYLGATKCAASVGTACTVEGVPYPAALWPLVNTTSQG